MATFLLFLSLLHLGSIFTPAAFSISYSSGIQNTAHDMITHPGQVFYPSAANHHNLVFLQVMANTGDISGNFHTIGKSDSGDFPQRRIRFFRSGSTNLNTDSAFKWTLGINRLILESVENILKSRRLGFFNRAFSGSSF